MVRECRISLPCFGLIDYSVFGNGFIDSNEVCGIVGFVFSRFGGELSGINKMCKSNGVFGNGFFNQHGHGQMDMCCAGVLVDRLTTTCTVACAAAVGTRMRCACSKRTSFLCACA